MLPSPLLSCCHGSAVAATGRPDISWSVSANVTQQVNLCTWHHLVAGSKEPPHSLYRPRATTVQASSFTLDDSLDSRRSDGYIPLISKHQLGGPLRAGVLQRGATVNRTSLFSLSSCTRRIHSYSARISTGGPHCLMISFTTGSKALCTVSALLSLTA